MVMDIIYWGIFALTVIVFVVWVLLMVTGFGDPLGYTRASVEDTPTDKDGNP
jgi:hypothetical protein